MRVVVGGGVVVVVVCVCARARIGNRAHVHTYMREQIHPVCKNRCQRVMRNVVEARRLRGR